MGRGSDGDKGWIVLWLYFDGGQISQNFHSCHSVPSLLTDCLNLGLQNRF